MDIECWLPAAGCGGRPSAVRCQLPVVCRLFPVARRLLLAACCVLPAACCLMLAICFSLLAACCLPYIRTCIYVCTFLHVCAYTYMYRMYMQVCVCIEISIFMYSYTYMFNGLRPAAADIPGSLIWCAG